MKPAFESLGLIGVPACATNEHGRITVWNQGAVDFFRLSAESVLGREWHTVIDTVQIPGCCALCKTRRSLREGKTVRPVEVTLSVDGYYQRVTMVPLPVGSNANEGMGILVLTSEATGSTGTDIRAPIPFHSRVRQLGDDRMIDELTEREREILACVVNGCDARSIASQVGISHATARNYVQRILSKLGVRNKAEAVRVALSYNLLAS